MAKQTISNPIIIEDFGASTASPAPRDEKRGSGRTRKLPSDCAGAVALIVAYSTATTPLKVEFEDPEKMPVTCEPPVKDDGTPGDPAIRALQTYEGKPLIAYAIAAAEKARAQAIYVLAPEQPRLRDDVAAAALAAARNVPVTVLPFCAKDAGEARVRSRNFELYDIPYHVLEIGRDALREQRGADKLLIMACDQVRITPDHLAQLCVRNAERSDADVVTSWITWLRRTPYLVTQRFLEDLEARIERASYAPAPLRAIEQLAVQEVVFGEEKLAANMAFEPRYEEFFKNLKLSALQAVKLAHLLEELPKHGKDAEKKRQELTAGLTDADKQLLGFAQETLAAAKADYSGIGKRTLRTDLAWADTWGTRNKADFPIFKDRKQKDSLVFLDSAATTQRVGAALEAQHTFDVHENANVYRAAYDLSMQATFTLNDARAVLEGFIGAERRETIFTSNATGGCNLVAQCWGERNIGAGDLIVVPLAEHHSNLLSWMMLAKRKGARLAYVPLTSEGRIDQKAYRELLRQKPKLVCFAQCGNVLGMEAPVAEMAAAAHKAGARVFVDGAQALPHERVNVRDLGVDFYAFSAHKLYGPLGIGGVWIHPDAYAEMDPTMSGGGAISHVATDSYYLRLGSIAYEWGTPPISQAIGMAAAIEYLGALGMDHVSKHSATLTSYLMAGLSHVDGITVWGDHSAPDGRNGLVSLSVAGMSPTLVGITMGKLDVAVRSGGHCALPLSAALGVTGTARLSFGVYNTIQDIEAALTGLRACRWLAGTDVPD